MRIAPLLRRLGPALLAVLVLAVSLAAAAHGHAPAARRTALQAAPSAAEPGNGADFACALCASAARLGHGSASASLAVGEPPTRAFGFPVGVDPAPIRVVLAPSGARAPPRHG